MASQQSSKFFLKTVFSGREAFMNTIAVGSRINLKNILFATDLSECANKALPYALSVARRHGATVHAACVMPTSSALLYMEASDWESVAAAEERQISDCTSALEKQVRDVPHRVTIPTGNTCDALMQIIKEQSVDLLVVGTHGRTGVRKLLMGSVAENLLRRAECPVLSIGPNVSGTPLREARFRHILFATDFSQESLSALPYAISLAEEEEARLLLLHVVNEPAAGIVDLESTTRFLERRLKSLIPPEADFWCHTDCLIEFGPHFAPPAERILQIAQSRAIDLIVLGVRPVRDNMGLTTHLSSTTAQILTQATCPVLTVRG
jgi:nucleotide-binding universal stress UspA family protein